MSVVPIDDGVSRKAWWASKSGTQPHLSKHDAPWSIFSDFSPYMATGRHLTPISSSRRSLSLMVLPMPPNSRKRDFGQDSDASDRRKRNLASHSSSLAITMIHFYSISDLMNRLGKPDRVLHSLMGASTCGLLSDSSIAKCLTAQRRSRGITSPSSKGS